MAESQPISPADPDVLVRASGVSKKFCLSLKKSLWYGLKDMGNELLGRRHGGHGGLRPKEFWAVNDVGFELRRGECIGLIGRNGAGKTTLLKMLNGLIKPDSGRIEMRGRVGALIALGAGFNPVLTGRENIYVNASVLGLARREVDAKIDEIIEFAGIGDFLDTPVQNYSSGMAVRLGFAVASSLNPDILLLDEVLAVGDMGFQTKCFNRLGEMRRRGIAFILVSHNMHHITRFCDSALYLKHGRIAAHGRVDEAVELFTRDMALSSGGKEAGAGASSAPEAGSKNLVVESVTFKAGDEIVSKIPNDRPVALVLQYRCRGLPVEDPVVELLFRDPMGNALIHVSNRMVGFSLGTIRDAGTLEVAFERIPANGQDLALSIALWDSTCKELHFWRRGQIFKTCGNSLSMGQIVATTRWALSREA